MIEDAYPSGERLGLSVWCCDQAGPFQTVPHPGPSWQPEGPPAKPPRESIRNGTAQVLTMFHAADGRVRVEGVTTCPDEMLHPWRKRERSAILAGLPDAPPTARASRAAWERGQQGLSVRPTLASERPPLRMLLVPDNWAGHRAPEWVLWLFAHGIMPLYTPVGGSWLNMAESIQRVRKRRALDGQHPESPEEIIAWIEAVARHWNKDPTPFEWGGKRKRRRDRQRERRHRTGGSGGYTRRPVGRRTEATYGQERSK